MPANPSICHWLMAKLYQVKSVTALCRGQNSLMYRSAEIMKLTVPNLMKQNGLPAILKPKPDKVRQTTTAMASTGRMESIAAYVLTDGSHAGTGALRGMPHHVPKNIRVRKPNMA